MVAVCLVVLAAVRLAAGREQEIIPAAETLRVTGRIYQKDEQYIYLKDVSLSVPTACGQSDADSLQSVPCKVNFICETERAYTLPLGSLVTLEGFFSPFAEASNPGEFDAAAYYRTLGIGGRIKGAEVISLGAEYWPVREGLSRLKYYFKQRLGSIFPEKEAAVMGALLLGDKGSLDGEVKDLYKRNGILHILSISSLHITIIGMSVYRLLRKAGTPIRPAAVAGSLLLLLYGGMTGFGISACRAVGMYLLKMLAEVTGRTYDMLTALGVLAAVLVTANPYYLQNSGFLLSFTSVLGIGAVYPALALGKSGGGVRKLLDPALASLSVTLATLPVQLSFYYEVPVWSVLLNLLVIPFVKPLVVAGLLALLTPVSGIWVFLDRVILRWYESLCNVFDRLPFHTWNPGCPGWGRIVAYYLLLAAAVAAWNHRKKGSCEKRNMRDAGVRRLAGAAACGCGVFLALGALAFPAASENSVLFLDVGQGDCILVRTAGGGAYLFDCGSSSRGGVGEYVLLPCLKYYGIQRLDAVFLSHPDADHVNGVLELLGFGEERGVAVGEVVLPAIEREAREGQFGDILKAASDAGGGPVPVGYLYAGLSWGDGGAWFTCLHPGKGYGVREANAYSECVYVEFREKGGGGRGWSLLLTGDVEGEGEEALLAEILGRDIRGVTVLKAAHHGSRNSTSRELLEQICPAVTVISCGRDNRYGHPHPQLLDRLGESGTYVAQTARCGAVMVTMHKDGLHVTAYAPRDTADG